MALYPIFLKLDGLECLVVGGGEVAFRKVRELLDAGAKVTVIAPSFVKGIKKMANKLKIVERNFEPKDLDKMSIAIAATDSEEVNRLVFYEAKKRNIWVNVVDSPELCDFFLPARIRLKNLEIAVSTLGKSPLAARLIRDLLEKKITKNHLKLIEVLSNIREALLSQVPDTKKRQKFWKKFGTSQILRWAEKGDWQRIFKEAESCGLRLPE